MEVERQGWRRRGFPEHLAVALQGSRRPSTLQSYDRHWSNFSRWCVALDFSPLGCSLQVVLQFLWEGFEKGLAVSTLRAQWAAVRAFRSPWGNLSDVEDLVSRLFRSFSLSRPVVRPSFPLWDLPLVLRALVSPPFEPLSEVDIKFVTLKVVFLVAITSARRLGELGALMAREPFLSFSEDGVVLRLDSSFVPKVSSQFHRSQELVLPALGSVMDSPGDPPWSLLDVCRALRVYLERTASFRKSDSLFVTFGVSSRGGKASSASIGRWLKQVIALAYSVSGSPPPAGVQGRSTRGVAASWAEVGGVNLSEICRAATWASSNTFIRHYRLQSLLGDDVNFGLGVLNAVCS